MKRSICFIFLFLVGHIFCMHTFKEKFGEMPLEVFAQRIIPYAISDIQEFESLQRTCKLFKEILDTHHISPITYWSINKLEPQLLVTKSVFQKIALEHAFNCPKIKDVIETVVHKIKTHVFAYVKYADPLRCFSFAEKLTYNPILHKNNLEEELLKIFTYKARRLHAETKDFLDYWSEIVASSPLTPLLFYKRKKLTLQNIMHLKEKFSKPLKYTQPLEKEITKKIREYIRDAIIKYEL